MHSKNKTELQLAENLAKFAYNLHEIGAVKYGEFITKSGLPTPVYCDLRVIISHPKLLDKLSGLIAAKTAENTYDLVCGVPYTALPIATAYSLRTSTPMLMRRKEPKSHGTKQQIEGVFSAAKNRCLLIEDVVTTGGSVIDTVKDLRRVGVDCTDCVVVVDRQQGAEKALNAMGIRMRAIFTLAQLLNAVYVADLMPKTLHDKLCAYLKDGTPKKTLPLPLNRLSMRYENRIVHTSETSKARVLFELIARKHTNLCVACDLTTVEACLKMADLIGPHICLLKTHVDIVGDATLDFPEKMVEIARRHDFLLLEDRKFADIGRTVQLQSSLIGQWADFVTAHSIMGRSTLDAIHPTCGVFLLAEASSEGNLISEQYSQATVEMALANGNNHNVVGVVCQSPLFLNRPDFIQLTPGVHATNTQGDSLGQQYTTPTRAVLDKGADIVVVGRGVIENHSAADSARRYKEELWAAYLKRTTINDDQQI